MLEFKVVLLHANMNQMEEGWTSILNKHFEAGWTTYQIFSDIPLVVFSRIKE